MAWKTMDVEEQKVRFVVAATRRCCVCYLILLWTRDQTHLAPAFPTPALRNKREGRGTHCVGDASEIKSLGHPPM
jgi:hypothetical protein